MQIASRDYFQCSPMALMSFKLDLMCKLVRFKLSAERFIASCHSSSEKVNRFGRCLVFDFIQEKNKQKPFTISMIRGSSSTVINGTLFSMKFRQPFPSKYALRISFLSVSEPTKYTYKLVIESFYGKSAIHCTTSQYTKISSNTPI